MDVNQQIEEFSKDAYAVRSPRSLDALDADIFARRLWVLGYRKKVDGEWIAKNPMIRSPLARNYYCSVCRYEPLEIKNYCLNCGASMKGGK